MRRGCHPSRCRTNHISSPAHRRASTTPHLEITSRGHATGRGPRLHGHEPSDISPRSREDGLPRRARGPDQPQAEPSPRSILGRAVVPRGGIAACARARSRPQPAFSPVGHADPELAPTAASPTTDRADHAHRRAIDSDCRPKRVGQAGSSDACVVLTASEELELSMSASNRRVGPGDGLDRG
jgi:hypothetical protein